MNDIPQAQVAPLQKPLALQYQDALSPYLSPLANAIGADRFNQAVSAAKDPVTYENIVAPGAHDTWNQNAQMMQRAGSGGNMTTADRLRLAAGMTGNGIKNALTNPQVYANAAAVATLPFALGGGAAKAGETGIVQAQDPAEEAFQAGDRLTEPAGGYGSSTLANIVDKVKQFGMGALSPEEKQAVMHTNLGGLQAASQAGTGKGLLAAFDSASNSGAVQKAAQIAQQIVSSPALAAYKSLPIIQQAIQAIK